MLVASPKVPPQVPCCRTPSRAQCTRQDLRAPPVLLSRATQRQLSSEKQQRSVTIVLLCGGLLGRRARKWRTTNARSRPCDVVRRATGPRVAVIGAGPAGLATALALRRETCVEDVTVFERSAELRPNIGGGLQLHGGAALLEELGVPIQSIANPLRKIRGRASSNADTLLELDLPDLADTFDFFSKSLRSATGEVASCTVMRDALLKAIADELPPESLRFNSQLITAKPLQGCSGVECTFSNGSCEQFDLVIAADGISSSASSEVLESGTDAATGSQKSDYTGLRIQYGVRKAGGRPSGSEQEAHQWFANGTYALTATYGGLGSETYEMIALVFRDEKPVPENSNWDPAGVREDCLERLRASGQHPEVLAMAEGCDRFFELGVCQRPVGSFPWHRGRLVLVGDAAHAMPPFLGQGANQAIQDAVCVARWLKFVGFSSNKSPDIAVESALYAYTLQRLLPVAIISLESNFLGQLETLPGNLGSFVRDNVFRLFGKSGVAGVVFLNGALVRA